jgi:hypothetical protein
MHSGSNIERDGSMNLKDAEGLTSSATRWIVRLTILVGVAAIPTASTSHAAGQTGRSHMNPIVRENAKPGTTSWKLVKSAWPDQLRLSGYASAPSVNHGGAVTLYVTDDAGPEDLSLDVYRMGWYQGTGGRLIEEVSHVAGQTQPACTIEPVRRTVSCANWSPTYVLQTGRWWVSGDYLIKITDARGFQTYIPLTVRNDASHSSFLALNSVNTWQAYNWWGGYSLYGQYASDNESISPDRAYGVSFDRPSVGDGAAWFLKYEFSEVSWLEREGYDVKYTTDVDVDLRPRLLLQHKALLVLGHSEYWSTAMRSGFGRARNEGKSLGFLGGNDVYRHVRYESSSRGGDRIVVCYKSEADPEFGHNNSQVTTQYRDPPLNRPENSLMGEMWAGIVDGDVHYVVADARGWEYAGTGATRGEASPGNPVSADFDTVFPNGKTPPGLTVLGASPAIPEESPQYAGYALEYRAQCHVAAAGAPLKLHAVVRSRTAFAIWLMLKTASGTVIHLGYDSYKPSEHYSGVPSEWEVDVSRLAPPDGRWHTIVVHPQADLSKLGGPSVDSIVGVWVVGQVDAGPITITSQQPSGTAHETMAGPYCPWSTKCPTASASFCYTSNSAGGLDGSVTRASSPDVGTYDRFRPVPAVADTTIYRAASGALVFDAGNYGWGSGLSGADGDANAWWVIDRLMVNVLNRMVRR